MAQASRQDLRDRAIDAALSGLPARQVAARFGVGDATSVVCLISDAKCNTELWNSFAAAFCASARSIRLRPKSKSETGGRR